MYFPDDQYFYLFWVAMFFQAILVILCFTMLGIIKQKQNDIKQQWEMYLALIERVVVNVPDEKQEQNVELWVGDETWEQTSPISTIPYAHTKLSDFYPPPGMLR